MSESSGAADVRLTIPAHAPYPELAHDVVAKFAEYSGAGADAAKRLAARVQALAAKIGHGDDVTFTLEARDDRLYVTVAAGGRHEKVDISL